MTPLKIVLDAPQTVVWCACGATRNPPFCDGSHAAPTLRLWRFRDGRFEGPRVALTHHGSFHSQILHVHPRFSPDGKQILFVSDMSGYGNLYQIDTPDFDALPGVEEG